MPDLEAFILAAVVIGMQVVAFAAFGRPTSAGIRILTVGAVVIFFLIMPEWWAALTGVGFSVAVWLCAAHRGVLSALLVFVAGFLGVIPVFYGILWISVHALGRGPILSTLVVSAFVIVALLLSSIRAGWAKKPGKAPGLVLLGASVCLLAGAIFSLVSWDAFTET